MTLQPNSPGVYFEEMHANIYEIEEWMSQKEADFIISFFLNACIDLSPPIQIKITVL